MSSGVAHVHGQGVLHGDLHKDTFLVRGGVAPPWSFTSVMGPRDECFWVQLIDFGLSCDCKPTAHTSTERYSQRYRPPELLLRRGWPQQAPTGEFAYVTPGHGHKEIFEYDLSADVWCLACVMSSIASPRVGSPGESSMLLQGPLFV